MADRQQEPDRRPEFAAFARRGRRHGGRPLGQFLGGGAAFAPQPDKGRGDLFGAEPFDQGGGLRGLIARRIQQRGGFQHALIVAGLHIVGRGGLAPFRDQFGALQQALRLFVIGRGHDQDRCPLGPRPAGAARTVQKRVGIGRQIGMDHQFQPRQVDAPRRNVGRDADPRPPVAQGLERM